MRAYMDENIDVHLTQFNASISFTNFKGLLKYIVKFGHWSKQPRLEKFECF